MFCSVFNFLSCSYFPVFPLKLIFKLVTYAYLYILRG
uniref:Uncharacterized protein n=1 Tax=Anguilla anguilla TaxID=7936 RepID=A0A0E9QD23_ANGAN